MRYLIAMAAALVGSSELAASGGQIDVLRTGSYVCELPGDAAGLAGVHQPAEDFAVVNASNYAVGGARGSYLLTGEQMTITSGPKRGARYRRVSGGTLRALDGAGRDTALHCVRGVPNNS